MTISLRRLVTFVLVLMLFSPALQYGMELTQEEAPLNKEKGGIEPMLASCCIGPRVGLEMNEGQEIHQSEWIGFAGSFIPYVGFLARAYMAADMGVDNGIEGFLASYCIGPRVGNELHYRKVRNKEWLRLVPCINLYPWITTSLDAYNGMTMTEIEKRENLRK
ncbi:MAG: hypothetical protein K9M80_00960 [Candidatus Marinimicrobia bacterium]|nr:hypothetical protein [Candidatus Neomarinimicrobiota bacterium]